MATTPLGPVEFVAIAFPTGRVPDGVKVAIADLLGSDVVTLLDLTVIRKGPGGEIDVVEVEDLGDELDITETQLGTSGLAGQEDIDDVAGHLAPGTSALVLVVEHTWARQFVGAVRDAGAAVIAQERIPADVVNEIVQLADVG
ncbi:hypothetical protein H9623_06105 [Oerskovia sp. Sa1BUA8]|uniref:DUF1269 domain-containing protein n=1 Tax=Oerskovia douganii TaxID=2762210 RepID=A0A9D5U8R9_9CELL|nr:DUF6325 family protein [Oerskovia douganii]MBE7699884.1 hypothetical protein [Oerskovia douganii]